MNLFTQTIANQIPKV